jgi:prophage maintenance system killer protein
MNEQANLTNQDGSQTSWRFASQEQRNDASAVFSYLPQKARQSDSQGAEIDEPYWPTTQEAVDLNKQAIGDYHQIFGDSPEWGGILKPNELESAIGSAQNHYAYDPEPDDAARYAQAIAKMGWRIAGNQTFANGNKRTAYGLTQHALDKNGLGHLSPIDQPDPELVDHLIAQDSYSGNPNDRQRLENEYLNMWQQRYAQGGPTQGYQQRYPEGTYITNPQEAQTQNLQGLARRSNILDEVHNELSPLVFNNPASDSPELKPGHRHWILKEIYHTLETAGYTSLEEWLTLCLTGSICTYQYSNDSDIDVSLFVDSVKFPEWSRAEMVALMVEKMDGRMLPGTQFPMQDFVVMEGIKPSDLYKPGLRSAYSIDTNKWIVPPERNRVYDVAAEEGGFYAYALAQADKMQTLLRYEPDKAIMLWHQIHKKRQRDMKKNKGDAAESNLVYKFLFKRGLIPQIADYSGEYIAHTDVPTKPPHLRNATSDKKYCGNCDAYKKGHCQMFGGYKVREDQVCDDWEKKHTKSTL